MERYTKIKDYVASFISLTNDQWEIILDALEIRVLSKNDYLLQEGEISDSIAFINSGVLIYYKNFENGDQMTTDFAFETDWVTDNYS